MKISVLGGGISGLVAAYNLSLNPAAHVSLYESTHRFGGWIETRKTDNNALFEIGPHSIRCVGNSGTRFLEFIDEIAMNQEVRHITKHHPAAQHRYLGIDGKLVHLPHNVRSALNHPYRNVFAKGLFLDIFTKGRYSGNDESVYMFMKRRFGREIADLISDPVCRGILASDSRTLGVSAVFPQLVAGEFESRSILKAMYNNKINKPDFLKNEYTRNAHMAGWRMLNFNKGMEQLPRAILNMLKDKHNVDIYDNSPVDHISVRNPEVSVTVEGGKPRHCDHIVSALPAHVLAKCLKHEPLSLHLKDIQFVDVALVSLEFRDTSFDLKAFGCLIPSYENPAVLGIIFDSAIFPEFDTNEYQSYRLSLMLGGEWFSKYFGDAESCDKALIERMALDAVRQYLKINSTPSQCHVDILAKCIPHYTIGHRNKIKFMFRLIQEQKLRLSLVGSSYLGAGVPDCVANAIEHTEPLHAIMNDRYFPYSSLDDLEAD